MSDSFEGHSHPVTRDEDIVRCDECKELMRIPKEDLMHRCTNCGTEYRFAFEEETNETDS